MPGRPMGAMGGVSWVLWGDPRGAGGMGVTGVLGDTPLSHQTTLMTSRGDTLLRVLLHPGLPWVPG